MSGVRFTVQRSYDIINRDFSAKVAKAEFVELWQAAASVSRFPIVDRRRMHGLRGDPDRTRPVPTVLDPQRRDDFVSL